MVVCDYGSLPLLQHHIALELLAAIESTERLRPRDRLALGLREGTGTNGAGRGVELLYNAAISSLVEGNEPLSIRLLAALGELCREVECAELLGTIGGHMTILGLMSDGEIPGKRRPGKTSHFTTCMKSADDAGTFDDPLMNNNNRNSKEGLDTGDRLSPICSDEGGEEDDVQAAAAKVAARVATSGCAFPMRAALSASCSDLFGRYPLQYDFALGDSVLQTPTGDSGSRGSVAHIVNGSCTRDVNPGSDQSNHGRAISILVRPVKDRQHSQFDVGFQMWPAAIILSRWLCAHPEVARGRSVLEIGAGLGLCGLVAAHLAPSVTLSDFNPVVLRALEKNVCLNAGWTSVESSEVVFDEEGGVGAACPGVTDGETAGGSGLAIDCPGRVRIRHLDWDLLDVPHSQCASRSQRATELFGLGSEGDGGELDVTFRERGVGDFKCLYSGERFDLIIASDHICQVRPRALWCYCPAAWSFYHRLCTVNESYRAKRSLAVRVSK